jgi:arylsulfatase A-like enzyme
MTEDHDAALGMILDKLKDLGIANNTYVIYFSDNGALCGNEMSRDNLPLAGGKASIWEGGIRVPLIIRGPGIKAGAFSHVPVVGYDLYPTILDWVGSTKRLPDGVEGGSLTTLLTNNGKGAVKRPSEGLVFHFPHYQHEKFVTPQSAIIFKDYKLIKSYETNQTQLFDLTRDIGETQDLSEKMPEKTKELHERLSRYLKEVGASMPRINPEYDPERDPKLMRKKEGS